MRRWGLACWLLALGGCNAVLGLDSTISAARDRDGDGVDDAVDNCPGLANPLQLATDCVQGLRCETTGERTSLDGDRDGIDDGCDACLSGPPADEDGDGIEDGCDLCPARGPGPVASDLTDADGDGIGDACDLAPGVPQERLLFDGFNADRLSIVWNADVAWTEHDGVISTDRAAVLAVRDLQIAGDANGTWAIEIGIELPATASPGDEIGLDLEFASMPARCRLVAQPDASWRLQLATRTTTLEGTTAYEGKMQLRASLVRTAFATPFVRCEGALNDFAELQADSVLGPFVAMPYTTAAGTLRYVEIQGRH